MVSFKKTIYVLNYPITIEIPSNLSEYTNDVPFVAKDSLSSLSTLTLYNEVYLHPLSSDKQSYINFGIYDSMSGKSYRLPLSQLGSLIPDYSSGEISSVFVLSQNGYLQKTSLSDLITYISDNAKTYKKVPSDLSNTYVFSWVDNQLSKVSLLSIIQTSVSKEVSKQTDGKSIIVYSLYLTPDYINTNSDMSAYYDGANTLISMTVTGISSNGVLSTVVFDSNNYITLTANGQERKLAATGSSISLNIKSMFPIPVKSGIIFKLYVNNQIAASLSLKFVACGQDGAQGKDGKSGKDGKDGTSGTSGKDGADATQYVLYIDPDFVNVTSNMLEYRNDDLININISAAAISGGISSPITLDGPNNNYIVISSGASFSITYPNANPGEQIQSTNLITVPLSEDWESPSIGGWNVKLYVQKTLVASQYIKVVPDGYAGLDGQSGETVTVPGDSYDQTYEYYNISSSATYPGASWLTPQVKDEFPEIPNGWTLDSIDTNYGPNKPYLWNALIVKSLHYKTSTQTQPKYEIKPAHMISRYGADGTNGTNGTNGKNGKSVKTLHHFYKVLLENNNSTPGHNFTANEIIGIYTENRIILEAQTSNHGSWSVDSAPNMSEQNKYLWEWICTIDEEDLVLSFTSPWLSGQYGTAGADGKQGLQGAIIRNRGYYSDLAAGDYLCNNCNDNGGTTGILYIDVVLDSNNDLWQFKWTNANSDYGRKRKSEAPLNTTYFVKSTQYLFIASDLIISRNILNKIFLTELIYFYDFNSTTIRGGIAGKEGLMKVSGSTKSYLMWLGGAVTVNNGEVTNVNNPTFALMSDGSGVLANGNISWDNSGNAHFSGSGVFNGEVYATGGTFKGAVTATSGSFTGTVNANSGTFKGDIQATSFSVLNTIAQKPSLILTIWTQQLSQTYVDPNTNSSIGIDVGTPVLIAQTYNSSNELLNLYVVNLTKLTTPQNSNTTIVYTPMGTFNYLTGSANIPTTSTNYNNSAAFFSSNTKTIYKETKTENNQTIIRYVEELQNGNYVNISNIYTISLYTTIGSIIHCSTNNYVLKSVDCYEITYYNNGNISGSPKYLYVCPIYNVNTGNITKYAINKNRSLVASGILYVNGALPSLDLDEISGNVNNAPISGSFLRFQSIGYNTTQQNISTLFSELSSTLVKVLHANYDVDNQTFTITEES